jgi:lysophospholipase
MVRSKFFGALIYSKYYIELTALTLSYMNGPMKSHIIFFIIATIFDLSGIFISSAYAVSEINYFDHYENEVVPYYKNGNSEFFLGQDGIKIAYRVFEVPHENGALVILPGRGMPLLAYFETIYDLNDLGFSVYIMDHRGQGQSGRLTSNSQMQYVKRFDDYVDDLSLFMDLVVNAKPHSKRFLLTDSMGGAIGTLYSQKYPKAFDAAILSTPMFGIYTYLIPKKLGYEITKGLINLGYGESYALGQHDFKPITAKSSIITHSQSRYEMMCNIFEKYPETTIGGVSNQWLNTSIDATNYLKAQPGIEIPTLIILAQQDWVVLNQVSKEFCKKSTSCQTFTIPDAYHEVFLEKDVSRNIVLDRIKSFFKEFLMTPIGK